MTLVSEALEPIMLTCSLSKAKIVVVAYLIHITGVYPQNFEWPGCGVLVRGITMPTLSFKCRLKSRFNQG